jgi:hypothetical protein
MNIEELLARESIRQTMATYTMAGDRLRADEFASAFTEDAVLESDQVPEQDAFRFQGVQAIRGWLTRWSGGAAEAASPRASFVRHHLSTCQIQFADGMTATARTYWTAYTDIGPDHGGYYLDSFRKVGERWLIAHRKVRLDWRSPDSLFTSAVARSR